MHITVEDFDWSKFEFIKIQSNYIIGLYEGDYIEIPKEEYKKE
tara:strand:- start:66 stop:194 length:129 start_codon:yes stop_codon:yes gene_type:complete